MRREDVPKRCTWNAAKEEWRCNKCGSVIMAHEQVASLHTSPDSNMPNLGFGETVRRVVPWCPECESKPSDHGIAYYGSDEDPDVQDLRIIRKIGEKE